MVKMGSGEGVEAEAIGNSGKTITLMGVDAGRILIGRARRGKFLLLLKVMQPVSGKTMEGEVQVGKGIKRVDIGI